MPSRFDTDRVHVGMGTLHAWESYGDNVAPDIQAVAKGLGGGYVVAHLRYFFRTE